jgi:NTE family protein
MEVLPVKSGSHRGLEETSTLCPQGGSRIKGISGASAGSITAYLLALGYSSSDIAKLLSDADTFNAFYDGPDNGSIRRVDRNRYRQDDILNNPLDEDRFRKQKERPTRLKKLAEFPFGEHFDPSSPLVGLVGGAATTVLNLSTGMMDFKEPLDWASAYGQFALFSELATPLKRLISTAIRDYLDDVLKKLASKKPALCPLIRTITESDNVFLRYLYNLIYDRGLFPGFELRGFLRKQMVKYLGDHSDSGNPDQLGKLADRMSFEQFYDRSGVDLVVTGANITTSSWKYFGVRTTPQFPVIDAVALSASYPFAFKPVLVTNCEPYVESGFWIDGGFLNNLPIHAFDTSPDAPLNSNMLAFRLSSISPRPRDTDDGYKRVLRRIAKQEDCVVDENPSPPENTGEGLFDVLLAHAADIGGTALYPSEEGQLRTADEEDQTIPLYTFCLDTLEFAPPLSRSTMPIKMAYASTARYFNNLASWERRADEVIKELEALQGSKAKRGACPANGPA